jgi:hypothetical protein
MTSSWHHDFAGYTALLIITKYPKYLATKVQSHGVTDEHQLEDEHLPAKDN